MKKPRESTLKRLRRRSGMFALDGMRLWGRLVAGRLSRQEGWIRARNRMDRLIPAPDGPGVACDWRWTRDLAVCREFRWAGAALLREALRAHPIELRDAVTCGERVPDASFVIGHRGRHRLPHLLATIRSIAGQADAMCEIVVVEQSDEPFVAKHLPKGVRLLEMRVPPGAPYNRSAAFNAGVRAARADVVILHDGDLLVPRDYVRRTMNRVDEGFEVIDMKRFVFYLDEESSARAEAPGAAGARVDAVVQNLLGGGSLAVRRDAYFEIGGLDEAFVGWGGEDEEFWSRAVTRRVWPFAELPFVHLWHAPQPMKRSPDNPTAHLLRERLSTPVDVRIAALVSTGGGFRR